MGVGDGLGVGGVDVGAAVGAGVEGAAVGTAVGAGVADGGGGAVGSSVGGGGGGGIVPGGGAWVGPGVAAAIVAAATADELGVPVARTVGDGRPVEDAAGDGGPPPRTSPAGVLVASATGSDERSHPDAPMPTLAARRITAAAPTASRAAPSVTGGSLPTAPIGGSDAAPASTAWIDWRAAIARMQSMQPDAWMARSRGGSPSAPPASQSANRP